MSYTNNPLAILAGSGITVTPITGTSANTITISATGPDFLTVTTYNASPVVVPVTDEVVNIEAAGPTAVTLPVGVTGQVFYIKDGAGTATPITAITITPTADTIDGSATATIDVPYGALTLVYSGTEWKIL